jgi:hypothetical protein
MSSRSTHASQPRRKQREQATRVERPPCSLNHRDSDADVHHALPCQVSVHSTLHRRSGGTGTKIPHSLLVHACHGLQQSDRFLSASETPPGRHATSPALHCDCCSAQSLKAPALRDAPPDALHYRCRGHGGNETPTRARASEACLHHDGNAAQATVRRSRRLAATVTLQHCGCSRASHECTCVGTVTNEARALEPLPVRRLHRDDGTTQPLVTQALQLTPHERREERHGDQAAVQLVPREHAPRRALNLARRVRATLLHLRHTRTHARCTPDAAAANGAAQDGLCGSASLGLYKAPTQPRAHHALEAPQRGQVRAAPQQHR